LLSRGLYKIFGGVIPKWDKGRGPAGHVTVGEVWKQR